MGTRIEMLTTVPLPGIKTVRGVLWLAKKAAKMCLNDSGIEPTELEMVIFAGMYRDKHIGEPSIASLLQKEIGVNPNLYPLEGRTFSFDVNTGGCGTLNAIQIIDGFITSGRISKGIVITGDSEPFKRISESYNFQPSASAWILGKSENHEEFKLIKNYSYPEYLESFKSYISWKKRNGRAKYRNILVLEQSDSYLKDCIDSSKRSLDSFFEESGLIINDIDLIITSQSPLGFPEELEKLLVCKGKVLIANGGKGELHTSGPAFALKKVWGTEAYHKAKNILILTVGAGISTMVAWYKK